MNHPLHVLSLRCTNYRILKDVHITPEPGKPVVLNGDNGQGKTTILDALENVLNGLTGGSQIRKGETKAVNQVVLGNSETGETTYTFERKMTDKGGDALVIKDAEGKQVPSPAKFLTSLIGSGSAIDPTEIMQANPGEKQETFAKRQAQTLLERLGLAEQMAKIEASIKDQMEARKIKNSRIADLERDVTANQNFPSNTPDVPVDVAAMSVKMTECNSVLATQHRTEQEANSALRVLEDGRIEVAELEEKLASAKKRLTAYENGHREASMRSITGAQGAETAAATLQTIHDQLSRANEVNAAVTRKLAHKAAKEKLEAANKEVHALTTKIEALRESKVKIVKDAKLPVDDLEFSDAGLLYKGLPLSQESTGIQTRVCSLMAMAEQPQCRIILLRNATLLNTTNREIIHEIAKERGYQVWEEVFTETKPEEGLWIVDGEVVS